MRYKITSSSNWLGWYDHPERVGDTQYINGDLYMLFGFTNSEKWTPGDEYHLVPCTHEKDFKYSLWKQVEEKEKIR